MQLVVPRAVRMAVAIEAISCAMNFAVSFFVMFLMVLGVKNLVGAEGDSAPTVNYSLRFSPSQVTHVRLLACSL